MSFGSKASGASFQSAPTYHRPISSQAATRANGAQMQPQPTGAQFYGSAAPRGQQQQPQPQQQPPLSATQSLVVKPVRGSSAGVTPQREAAPMREVSYASPPSASTSARANLSRTQPLVQAFAALGPPSGPFQQQQQQSPQQFPSSPQQSPAAPWQHFRGPVAAVHRVPHGANAGLAGIGLGNSPLRVPAARPQSSYPSQQRSPQQQQSYNIITGGPVANGHASNGHASWEREEQQQGKPRHQHPVIVEHASGSRVYQSASSADQPPQPQHQQQQSQQQSQSSGRSSARNGATSQRSQSVGRQHANGRAPQQQQQQQSSLFMQHFDQSPNRPQLQQHQHSSAASSSFHPAIGSPQFDSQRYAGGGAMSSPNGNVRFSANGIFSSSPASPGQPQHHDAMGSTRAFPGSTIGASARTGSNMFSSPTAAPLAFTAPAAFSPSSLGAAASSAAAAASSSPSRPGSSAGSDDGAGFLEVGVAEDPNPRFRPTMEDAHVIKYGDWEAEAAAQTARGGGGKTTRRAASLDWGSTSRKSSSSASSSSAASSGNSSHGVAQKGVKSGYFAVYDGHGGREAVDYIERHLHRELARKLRDGAHPSHALEAAFLDTDAAMQQTRRYQDCGSTVASALLRPSTSRPGQRDLFAANAGDARTVIAVQSGAGGASGGQLQAVRLSRDHTPHDPSEADRVRRAGGAVFRGRVDGQLAVSRAIGDHSLKRSGVSAQPHQQHVPLTRDHKYLIVACDGLWDVMSDAEAVNLIAGMTDANKMADKLVKTAMARGTTDNVSAMVVRLQK